MSGQDIDPGGPGIVSQRNIMRVIAHDKRPRQIQPVLACSLLQKERPWLDAGALFLAPVRTAIDPGNDDTASAQFRDNVSVHTVHVLRPQDPGRYARLMGDDKQKEMLLKLHQSPNAIRVEDHLGRHPEMAAILDDRAVPI
jgi:hypothetical protein